MNLADLVSQQALFQPDVIACSCAVEQLTYAQLEQRSRDLALILIDVGIESGDRVGICVSKSCRALVAILATLKAQATFVPLDPDYPVERSQVVVSDAQLKLILSEETHRGLTQQLATATIELDQVIASEESAPSDLPSRPIPSDLPAYMIYTSGSTGTPKGVVAGHASAIHFVNSMLLSPGFSRDDVLLSASTLAFDISIYDLFVPLAAGGKIVFVDRDTARDGRLLASELDRSGATIMFATPSSWRMLLDAGWQGNRTSFRVFTGGEHLPREIIDPLLARAREVWNFYGPTEATVLVTRQRIANSSDRILVGEPIEGAHLVIVDPDGRELGDEEAGELLIAGSSLAIGYWNRPELQAERFVNFEGRRVYRTGDRCKRTAEGRIECLGRMDDQVKIRGHRIELGEVETTLATYTGVKQAAASVRTDGPGDARLVGYVIAEVNCNLNAVDLSRYLAHKLPDYMVPSAIVVLDAMPVTPNGKIDRSALPVPPRVRPQLATEYRPPHTDDQQKLVSIWSGVLGLDGLGIDDNFLQLGGNSLLVVQMLAEVERRLSWKISAARFFDHPTIAKLAELGPRSRIAETYALADKSENARANGKTTEHPQSSDRVTTPEFAIVGMAARFPGASNLSQFWDNLVRGVESIQFFSDEELTASAVSAAQRAAPNYVAARGVLDGAEQFDAHFFGIAPREAELIDPQQRIMLEVAWSALEDAGYVSDRTETRIGVWAGCFANTYYLNNILAHPDVIEETGELQLATFTEKDFIASRIAHHLDLRGPAINVNTACSTSLVAVVQACQALQLGTCDVALAGGATITFPQRRGHHFQEGNILTPDGHCRPFDADAKGTVFSDGAGMVVVKRRSDAERDGDRIYALITGLGINNDGGNKASFSAPSIDGQMGAIAMAHQMANVKAETISYIEAHGTATPIGDPIELAALTEVFRKSTTKEQFCAIGSVKSNIGHTVSAAGVAGLIKATLALHHETIPATLHFRTPNPALEIERSPFYVCDKLTAWPRSTEPRRAGVSSFGVGGTNAHIVIQESPKSAAAERQMCDSQWPIQLWPISAKKSEAVDEYFVKVSEFAESNSEADVSQTAFMLQTRRQHFNQRATIVCNSVADAAARIKQKSRTRLATGKVFNGLIELTWMFPGQGSQYSGMGSGLYEHVPVFRHAFDYCSNFLQPLIGVDLREILKQPSNADAGGVDILRSTRFTQPAIFSISYSLAQLWLSWGIRPTQLIGHSVGEFVAACLADVFSIEDGLRLIAKRGELLQALPCGNMLAVQSSAVEIAAQLPGTCSIAAINAPQLCVIAGPTDDIKAFAAQLTDRGIGCRELMTSHAFHSSMMDNAVKPFTEFVSQFELRAPRIPMFSTVTSRLLTGEESRSPGYWGQHLRSTVNFSGAVQTLLAASGPQVFLEVGPRSTLATLARQHVDRKQMPKDLRILSTLSDNNEQNAELASVLQAAGQLWCNGLQIDFGKMQAAAGNSQNYNPPSKFPGYPFQRKRYWLEPKLANDVPVKLIATKNASNEVNANMNTKNSSASRKPALLSLVNEVFELSSGIELSESDPGLTFLEMGINSLMLTQTAAALQKRFGVDVSFRQLLEQTPSPELLVDWLDERISEDIIPREKTTPADSARTNVATPVMATPAPQIEAQPINSQIAAPSFVNQSVSSATVVPQSASMQSTQQIQSYVTSPIANLQLNAAQPAIQPNANLFAVVQMQLQLMNAQLQLLAGQSPSVGSASPIAFAQPISIPPTIASHASATSQYAVANNSTQAQHVTSPLTAPQSPKVPQTSQQHTFASPQATPSAQQITANSADQPEPKKVFGAQARVALQSKSTDAVTQANLDRFMRQYNERTSASKSYTQKHRARLADPRSVSGFQPATKEITYPIVVEKSKGGYVWDIDGHRYIDLSSGFGSNFFGHSPDFMVKALTKQLETGYEIGPQSVLTGEVAELFCEMTGNERVAFCNTGSEAVLGAMRLARTVTGRDKFVMFTGDYHGILDEVIVRSNKKLVSFPAAPGIPQSAVQNVMVLEYGSEEALQVIERELPQLAAVIVESVQSRRPDYQPREFLHRLRQMTENVPTALIFDEVITGFRIGPQGAQGHFGVKADLGTYGKVIGGGMPIGVIAGKKSYMDALDGGHWQFGDSSRPEVGMTYFAGTFVRHPLALAAAKQTLLYLKQQGAEAYRYIQSISDRLERGLLKAIADNGTPLKLARFYSLFKLEFTTELPLGDLLFAAMRMRGIHTWEHRPIFLTLSHTEADIDEVIAAFDQSIRETQQLGFVPRTTGATTNSAAVTTSGVAARLGKDRNGNPGWFIPDAANPGQFLQVPNSVV